VHSNRNGNGGGSSARRKKLRRQRSANVAWQPWRNRKPLWRARNRSMKPLLLKSRRTGPPSTGAPMQKKRAGRRSESASGKLCERQASSAACRSRNAYWKRAEHALTLSAALAVSICSDARPEADLRRRLLFFALRLWLAQRGPFTALISSHWPRQLEIRLCRATPCTIPTVAPCAASSRGALQCMS
jgi:hypothetical protein